MIVLVGGMIRSGSTFSFNIVREALAARGGVECHPANAIEGDRREPHLVLKSHSPDQTVTELVKSGEVRCICSYRRPEDAIASWKHAFNFDMDESIIAMRQWLEWHRQVASQCLNLAYEDIDRRPFRTILGIHRWLLGSSAFLRALRLRGKYSKRVVKRQYDALPNDGAAHELRFSHYDPQTFFHRRHVSWVRSRRADELLSNNEIRRIREAFADFIDGDGFYRPPEH